MQIQIISVTQTNNAHTVVLQQGPHIVTVEGVHFEIGAEEGSRRIDVRLCTQRHLQTLFNNWVFEAIQGEGYIHETITLQNCNNFTCNSFTVVQSACGKILCASNNNLNYVNNVLQYNIGCGHPSSGATRTYTYVA